MQNFFQDVVDYLCDKYDFALIPVIADHRELSKEGVGVQYDYRAHRIVIDEREDANELLRIVYHEFRHYWQHIYYEDVFLWWLCWLGGLYRKTHNLDICNIEADARLFGSSLGAHNREDLLRSLDVPRLVSCRDDVHRLRRTLLDLAEGKNRNPSIPLRRLDLRNLEV